MSNHELPPLPETISKDMQSLRNVEPSSALIERSMASLPDRSAIQTTQKGDQAKPSFLMLMIPTIAVAAAAIFYFSGKFVQSNRDALVRVEEKNVALPESGHTWTALDLQTHHHADEPAVVHLEVPTNVRVRLPQANAADDVDERHCAETRCVHRFTQHHGKGVPVRIAVTHPGRYDIHVRHESKVAAMREHFVVTANRD
jgi:hypothetical protein